MLQNRSSSLGVSCTRLESHACLILRNVSFLPNMVVKLLRKLIHPAKTLWCKLFNHLQSRDGFLVKQRSTRLLSPQLHVDKAPECLIDSSHPYVLPHGTRMKQNRDHEVRGSRGTGITRCRDHKMQGSIKATCSPYVPRRHWNISTGESARVWSIIPVT